MKDRKDLSQIELADKNVQAEEFMELVIASLDPVLAFMEQGYIENLVADHEKLFFGHAS